MNQPMQPATEGTPVHDWLRPRLLALVAEADKAGLPRQTVVAVILDIVGAPPFDRAPPPQATALPPAPNTAPHEPLPMELETESVRDQAEQESQQEIVNLPSPWL